MNLRLRCDRQPQFYGFCDVFVSPFLLKAQQKVNLLLQEQHFLWQVTFVYYSCGILERHFTKFNISCKIMVFTIIFAKYYIYIGEINIWLAVHLK